MSGHFSTLIISTAIHVTIGTSMCYHSYQYICNHGYKYKRVTIAAIMYVTAATSTRYTHSVNDLDSNIQLSSRHRVTTRKCHRSTLFLVH